VFDPKWLDPFEAIVSILWKLARKNRLSGQAITTQLAKSDIDPYEGVAARRSEVDLCRLHLALGLPLKLVRDSVLPDTLQAAGGHHFRYCRKCLCRRRQLTGKGASPACHDPYGDQGRRHVRRHRR